MKTADNQGRGARWTVDDEDRQIVLLALAKLSVERPGWLKCVQGIAERLEGGRMFENFRKFRGPAPGSPKDTSNRFQVVRQLETIVVLEMNPSLGQFVFTKEEALLLSAWMAKLADPGLGEFHRVVQEIEKPSITP